MKLSDIHIRDPFILTDSGKYYLYGSRGNECWGKCTGLDVYESSDLETFSEPVTAFTPPPFFWSHKHYWAPEVYKYNGLYYMFVSFKNAFLHRGTQVLVSDSPLGPFLPHSKRPVTPRNWECLDGTLYVENGVPYMVFCHEWTQVRDGEMCAVRLSDDLSVAVGKPFLLFRASELPYKKTGTDCFVTDGPFLWRTSNGRLILLWSSGTPDGYCEAVAYSNDGTIHGKWLQSDTLLFKENGGHGMIFRDNSDTLRFVLHRPNDNPLERPVLYELEDTGDSLRVTR